MSFDADCVMVWLTWSRQCGGPLIGMAFDDSLSSAREIYLVAMKMHIRPEKKSKFHLLCLINAGMDPFSI